MLVNITELLADGRLSEALKGLAKHPIYETDNQFQTQVIMVTGAFNRLMRDEESGLISSERRELQQNRITHSIRSLAQRYGVTEVEAQPVKIRIPDVTLPAANTANSEKNKPVILFLGSNPKGWGKLQLEAEYVNILQRMGKKKDLFQLNTAFRTTSGELMETLLNERPAYLHFAGHGVPDAGENDPAGIVLETEDKQPKVVSGEALGAMFSLMVTEFEIKSVVLNACDTLEQARAISVNGIYTVGMSREIPDNVAISFAGGFYLGLAQKPDDIPRAFKYAITMLKLSFGGQDDLPKLFFYGTEVKV